MSLVSTRKPFDDLENTRVLLDTCTIIDASNCDDVDSYLRKMQDEGCTFLSLPAVREEFTCSAKGLEEYNESLEYLNSLNIVFLNNTERHNIGIYRFNNARFDKMVQNV